MTKHYEKICISGQPKDPKLQKDEPHLFFSKLLVKKYFKSIWTLSDSL